MFQVLYLPPVFQHNVHDVDCQQGKVENSVLQLLILSIQHDEVGHLLRRCSRITYESHALQGQIPEIPIIVSL